MHVMYACHVCMSCMHVMYACHVCMLCMHVMYACYVCMLCMHVMYACHVCMLCMHVMCASNASFCMSCMHQVASKLMRGWSWAKKLDAGGMLLQVRHRLCFVLVLPPRPRHRLCLVCFHCLHGEGRAMAVPWLGLPLAVPTRAAKLLFNPVAHGQHCLSSRMDTPPFIRGSQTDEHVFIRLSPLRFAAGPGRARRASAAAQRPEHAGEGNLL